MSSFPPWTNNNTYVVGDSVTYIGVVYSCILTNIDILPTNATYWVLNASANQTIVAGTGINVTGGSEPVVTVATNLSAGSNITLTPSGNNLTIASGAGGVSSVTGGRNINISGSSGQFPTVNLNTSLIDSSIGNSTGLANQNLTAGSGGGSLIWANAASGLSGGTGVSITTDNLNNRAVITNTGVTSLIAGTGIGASPTTGNVTLTNTGVTSLTPGAGITLSGSTGSITVSSTGGGGSVLGGRNINISGGSTVNLNQSLLDNGSSLGSQNQVFTAGNGSSLLWSFLDSILTSGNGGISIGRDSLNRAVISNAGVINLNGSSPISVSGSNANLTVSLSTSGVSANTYTLGNFTVDTTGRITSASSSSLSGGTGISISGPDGFNIYTITNTSPSSDITLTAGTNISIDGSNPNFTINCVSDPYYVGKVTAQGGFDDTNGATILNGNIVADSITGVDGISNGSLNISLGSITGAVDITLTGTLIGEAISCSSVNAASGLIKTLGTIECGTLDDGAGVIITGGNITADSVQGTTVSDGAGASMSAGVISTTGIIQSTVTWIGGVGLYDTSNGTGEGTADYILQSRGALQGYTWIAPPTTVSYRQGANQTISTTPYTTMSVAAAYPRRAPTGNLVSGTCYFSGVPPTNNNAGISYAQILVRSTTDGTNFTTLATLRASCPPNPAGASTTAYWTCPITYYDGGASTTSITTYSYSITFVDSASHSTTSPLLLTNSFLVVQTGQ